MPDVDGAALLKGIRITQSKVDLPVIVCSGSRDRSDYVRVSQHGVQGILQKPIKRAELLVCLQGALSDTEYDASSENLPVFDHQAALHRVGGDKSLLLELVVDLLKEWPTLLAGVRRAFTGKDTKEIASTAHGLKGMFASLNAVAAAEAAKTLETMGRERLLDQTRDGYSSLEMELHRLKDELENYVKANR